GSHGGFRTILLRFPEQKFSVILLANAGDVLTPILARRVADIYLENEFKEEKEKKKAESPSVSLTKAVCERYVGEYLFEAGLLVNIARLGDKLVLASAVEPQELVAVSETEFHDKLRGYRLTFVPDGSAGMKMLLDIAGTELTGKRLVQVKLTDDERKQFVGGYYSDELEVMYR